MVTLCVWLVATAATPLLTVCAHQFHALLQTATKQPHKLDTHSVFVRNLRTAEDLFDGVKLLSVTGAHCQRHV